MGIIKEFIDKIKESLFVNYSCLFCDIETSNASLICNDCMDKLTKNIGTICKTCGALGVLESEKCGLCYNRKFKFSVHRSCFVYNKHSSRPIKLLKYSKQKYLAEPIAKLMFALHKEYISECDYILYVPMIKSKQLLRGYNHAQEIAKELSRISGVEVLDCIQKCRDTSSQADLKYDERVSNLKDSFVLGVDAIMKIKGKALLVIDDVFTTGSTMNEIARILKKGRPKEIKCLTFLKTDPDDESHFLDHEDDEF